MKKHCYFALALAGAFLATMCMSSCSSMRPKQETYHKPARPEFREGTFEHFVYYTPGYPATMETYRNHNLLKQAGPRCPIYICLSQQRGRLYVNGQIAADWPVSTGTAGHPTPTGTFSIQEKRKEYASSSYGSIFNASGRLVKSNAVASRDAVPAGGRFRGASMPNWMRLTWDGVGMHTGHVVAGSRLSHGCIRTPGHMASQLFGITSVGTRVTVSNAIESGYPAAAHKALAAAQVEAAREKAIKDKNDARIRQWEAANPGAARRYAQRQAKANANRAQVHTN